MLRTTAVLQEVYKEGSWQLLLEAFTERWLWMILAGLWRRSTKSGCASGKSWGWNASKVATCSLVAALFLFSPSLCGFQPCGFDLRQKMMNSFKHSRSTVPASRQDQLGYAVAGDPTAPTGEARAQAVAQREAMRKEVCPHFHRCLSVFIWHRFADLLQQMTPGPLGAVQLDTFHLEDLWSVEPLFLQMSTGCPSLVRSTLVPCNCRWPSCRRLKRTYSRGWTRWRSNAAFSSSLCYSSKD